ncbi:MAG: alpha/beta hydrolase family protein, partial [Aggregatilineales bacterium]
MKRFYPSWILVLVLLCLLTGLTVAQDDNAYESRTLEINLGADFITEAELTYPAEGNAPYPTMILFHGSGPYDMDATYATAPGEEPLSANFKLLAERLAENGIATLRFNKRGVLGDGQFDMAQVQASTLDRLVDDALVVIDTTFEQPEVDSDAVYLYGWSEGAWVIANAAQERDVAGLIMQGAPDAGLDAILEYQYFDLAIPYLLENTDVDSDGLLTMAEVAEIPAGAVSYSGAFFFYQPGSDPENPSANSFTDNNGDGLIDIEGELRPTMELFLQNYSAFVPPVQRSYDTGSLLAELTIPTLLL